MDHMNQSIPNGVNWTEVDQKMLEETPRPYIPLSKRIKESGGGGLRRFTILSSLPSSFIPTTFFFFF